MSLTGMRRFDETVLVAGAILFVAVQLFLLYLRPISPLLHGIFFVTGLTAFAFLTLPARAGGRPNGTVPWYDYVLALLALVALIHPLLDYGAFVRRSAVTSTADLWVGLLMIALLLEATRRATGLILPVLALCFMLFAAATALGVDIPYFPTLSIRRLIGTLYITELGIFSEATQVAVRWIFIFLVFGQCLLLAGGQTFFTEVSFKAIGNRRGGPAYMAVISSALFGTLSGSNMANVMTTGQFTIPLMKRAGYSPTMAGAIESVASTGGALTPPVMAAGALIMAEMTGTPYLRVIEAALIPAILFYASLFVYVWGITQRTTVVVVPRETEPENWSRLLVQYWPVLAGLGWLIWRIVTFFPLEFAGLEASAVLAVGALFTNRKAFNLQNLRNLLLGLIQGTRDVGLACACAGILVGVILVSGAGVELSQLVITIGKDNLLIALVLTMIVTMILGMGVPGIAAYIIAATVVASSLSQLGVPVLGAHLFIFYFSLFAGITPPVALTAFAAAGLAGGDPFRTGFQSMVLALPTYLVAFFFIYQPEMLLVGEPLQIARATFTATIGVSAFALGTSGYLFGPISVPTRIVLVVAGLAFIDSGLLTNLVGAGLLLLAYFLAQFDKRRANSVAPAPVKSEAI